MYLELHHKYIDEPCVLPKRCSKWMLLLMKDRIHLLNNASGIINKVCLSRNSTWNSTKTQRIFFPLIKWIPKMTHLSQNAV